MNGSKSLGIVFITHRCFKQAKAFIVQEFIYKFLNGLFTPQSAQYLIKIAAKFYITIFTSLDKGIQPIVKCDE